MVSRLAVVVTLLLSLVGAQPLPTPRALADESTPTVAPTVAPVTVLPETPEATATDLPQVQQERSTPITTTQPPTEPPAPIATTRPLPSAMSVPTPRPLASPLPAATSSLPAVPPLPTAAQLEENARLRWGKHVPAAVRRWAFLIVPAARKYHLSANLIAAVMTMESGGDPLAWNATSDARGLMQVLHGPWDPKANILLGARMLAHFYAQFQDWTLALAAYNAGPNAVLEAGGVPAFRETHDYVIIVRYLWDLYNHRRLTRHRRAVYRATLADLARFADQRRKVARLAHLAQIKALPPPVAAACGHDASCTQQPGHALFQTLDPFWPVPGGPDPLQHVDPPAA